MTITMISMKLDSAFLHEVDLLAQSGGYHNRTELIRAALREKLEDERMRKALTRIAGLRGSQRKRTTNEEIDRIRQKVFDRLMMSSGR
jgi:Arc/MetJ-type ribon-helix-helix transcriptional regulator